MGYAIIRTGGKQHRVVKGERLKVDKLDAEVGSELTLSDVLLVGGEGAPRVGQPLVDGAAVKVRIVAHGRGEKIRVLKRRKRKGFRKTIGHRQDYTELEITEIAG